MFSLKLLGGAALERGGIPVTGRAVHRRRLALLSVLAAARGRMVGRERIIGLLWPEHPGDAARHLLSESLYILRKAIGEDAFVSAGDELSLDPAVVGSDLAEFQAALDADDLPRAAALYGGPFLDGFYVADAPDFERWAEEERERLSRAYARALEQLAEAREAEGAPLEAAEWWKRLARHDPYSARIALRVMRALETAGDRAAALKHAAVHAALMRDELETEPDAEIETLAQRLRESPRATPVLAAAAAAPPAARAAHAPAPEGEGGTALLAPPAEARPAVAPVPVPAAGPAPRGLRGIAAVAVVVGIALGLTFLLQRPSPAGVDASTYIVLPFVQRSGGGAALTPDQAELLLHNALSRWTDLRLVDAQRARDLLARNGPPATLTDARRIAQAAGAGHLVWGEITPLGDSVVVRAALYDLTRRAGSSPEHTVRVGRDLRGVSARIGELTSVLLGREASESLGPEGAAGTTSLAAWQAYQRGRLAMSRWDLGLARQELARAVDADAGYAAAHLWLAQAITWSEPWDPTGWREPAARALADSASLSPRERQMARALAALGERRYPDACRIYESMIARDSTDFTAWFGVGECHRRDLEVVRDGASPSGWRFRSSYHRAVQAYSRALRSVPSSHRAFRGVGFGRLHELLQAGDYVVRPGYSGDSLGFASYGALVADTLSFTPWPSSDVAMAKAETLPPTRHAAQLRNRRLLRDILLEWARAFPQSPDAHEALALGLEDLGEIRRVGQDKPSAFSELALARTLAVEADQRRRLAVVQVRLYLRMGQFDHARALADSVLAATPEPGSWDARRLAPLAVLTGRVDAARALLHASVPEQPFSTPQGRPVQVPVPVAEAAMDALLYAGLGMPREAGEAEARTEQLIRTWLPPDQRAAARLALLNAPRRLSFGTGGEARARRSPLAQGDFLLEAQQRQAAGDAAGAREILARLAAARGDRRPGDLTLDYVLGESALHLALGDTARALEELDRTLVALQALPRATVERVDMTGSLLGIMRLRARLAAARGDARLATHWRGVLRTLWSGGDPRLLTAVR